MKKECFEAIKDPEAILPYSINWASEDGTNDGTDADTGWLQGETISTSAWAVSGPDAVLAVDSDSQNAKIATVVLSAGTVNMEYTITNHIVTSPSGWEEDRSIEIRIVER